MIYLWWVNHKIRNPKKQAFASWARMAGTGRLQDIGDTADPRQCLGSIGLTKSDEQYS